MIRNTTTTTTDIASASEPEPTGELRLSDVMTLVLGRNPQLASAKREIQAFEGRLRQSGVRRNPDLSFAAENIGGNEATTGGMQSTLQLGQLIELGGKRAARVEIATAARDIAAADYNSRHLDIVTRATRAFIEVLAEQRRLELAEESVKLSAEMARTVGERVSAGRVSPIEETRAEVAVAAEEIDRDRARTELAAARIRLAALWGSSAPRFERVTGDLDVLPKVATLDVLAVRLERNPALTRWNAEIAEREAALRLEDARSVPDVTVGGGYRRFELGSNAFLVTAAIPLPLFDRNRGAREEARQRLEKAREDRRAVQVQLQQSLAESYAAFSRADAEVRSVRDRVVPGAESVYEAVTEGYRLGKFGYLEVLDARRTLAAARAQLARAQADLHRAYADLERLTGMPTNDMTNGSNE